MARRDSADRLPVRHRDRSHDGTKYTNRFVLRIAFSAKKPIISLVKSGPESDLAASRRSRAGYPRLSRAGLARGVRARAYESPDRHRILSGTMKSRGVAAGFASWVEPSRRPAGHDGSPPVMSCRSGVPNRNRRSWPFLACSATLCQKRLGAKPSGARMNASST